MDYRNIKKEIFDFFNERLQQPTQEISKTKLAREAKAKKINKVVETVRDAARTHFFHKYNELPKSKLHMTIQYCYTVMSFEYRNIVWPYEYMAFSRRNGELWERFCKAAWDYSDKDDLHRIDAPKFEEVRSNFLTKINSYVEDLQESDKQALFKDVSDIFELVGDINMKEDEMFSLSGINHIIDFKSGFGSNEKGNTLRLLAVGKAYKHWDSDINLLFLVRQNENNNYLEIIRKSNLWEVHCGDDSYAKIDELTNAGIQEVRDQVFDFKADLSVEFWNYLEGQGIQGYLDW